MAKKVMLMILAITFVAIHQIEAKGGERGGGGKGHGGGKSGGGGRGFGIHFTNILCTKFRLYAIYVALTIVL